MLLPVLLTAIFFACGSRALSQTYQGRQLVKAELLADTDAVVPGKSFTVGLLIHIVPGWHTYWRYPGDAGIPTELKWRLPLGWKVSEIEWPIPLRLTEPGDIQIYGYHGEVLLMQQVTPPPSVVGSSVKLTAEANWLVCEKICIPGSALVSLDLAVASQANAANAEIFTRYRHLLPQDWPGSNVATFNWQPAGLARRLTITSMALSNYPSVEFYPRPEGTVVVGHPKTESVDNGKIVIQVPLGSEDQGLLSLPGDIVFGQSADGANRNAWHLPNEISAKSPPPPSTGALRFLLFGLIGGFILNLMPCVLPVISLKIFGFIRHAGDSRLKILRSGSAFIAGIFAWFIGLALFLIVLKSAGHEITWAFQFTNPYFVLGMSAVVLVFALNLFGVFEISLPQSANQGFLNWTTRDDEAGAFFQGVFATVLATPCTAPYLGTALGFAFTQSNMMILLMFLAIAVGMGAPYLLLAAQPAWLRFLPKPGPWMVKVKELMGFLLLATLLFLLAVLGAQRGFEAIVWAAAFLLVLAVACWLKGSFSTPQNSRVGRVITVLVIIALVAAGGWYFIGEKFRFAHSSPNTLTSEDWIIFTPDRLQTELDQGHAVFIDFTAAWCITCKFNEATVLETSAVQDAFRRHGIVKFKADWTNADPSITKLLKQFGRPGVPLYVLYPAGKSSDPIVFPELLTKGILLNKIEAIDRNISAK